MEIIRRLDEEYAFGSNQMHCNLGIAMKIENWCKVNYGKKAIWNRKLPTAYAKDEDEKKIGRDLNRLKTVFKQYKGRKSEEIEDEEDRRILEIIRRLDEEYAFGPGQLHHNIGLAMQIENWCKRTYKHIEISNRRLPNRRAEDSEEKFLGEALMSLRRKLKKYEGKELEEVEDEEDRRILEIIGRLDAEYNQKKKSRTAKEIAEASISSLTDIEMSDREDQELKALVEKTKEGGIKLDEQS